MTALMELPKVNTMTTVPTRPNLDTMELSLGKKARLYRLMYQHGPGNGSMLFLPMDQGLEHGPMDFFVNPPCGDPNYQAQLALNGNYSAVVFQIGVAEKTMRPYIGKVPLVIKLNGKTCIPSDAQSFSPLTSSVEDAVRLGADAIGYTLYVGSPAQDRDIAQFNAVRKECERYGMPIIMWAYPRGEYVDKKGGKDSLYAIDYAARVACELGADIVKINYPKTDEKSRTGVPKPYDELILTAAEGVQQVVRSAGPVPVVFSGGSKVDDTELLNMARIAMENGGSGLIFGRNMWQRPMDQALDISRKAASVMREY
ncbi:MAG: hypothetical protein QE263_08565 [Vampirovibrionales bacterium]|nr:hypothetical protein [Vampirovibrionales bacterium]